ncbi:MAG: hypothetical protein AB7C91_04645 [Sphaerochaeta sp.]|jgi:hypothetical protein|uniref:hypothetical protein n=1 Tax=Sphaerochaeta sp. TaxID=1972642 RepID=UPI002FC92AB9
MKRHSLSILLLVLSLSAYAGQINPAQVTISLTTRVPEYLVHGFLTGGEESPTIMATADVEDAFNPDGAKLTYAIQTNVSIPLEVTATVSPFTRKLPIEGGQVGIDSVLVNDTAAEVLNQGNGTYKLLYFTPPNSGMGLYSYTLTVKANQDEVSNASSGYYESTVSIGIAPVN